MAENRAALLARQDTESKQYKGAVWSYRRLLGDAVRRDRQIASYRAAYTWEPQERTPDLEAWVQAEDTYWTEVLLRLDPEDPDAWCGRASNLPDPAERIEMLYERFAERSAQFRLATCLAHHLSGQNRREEAIAVLRVAYAENPHREVYRDLVGRLNGDALLAFYQAERARRPDEIEPRLEILRFLLDQDDVAVYKRGQDLAEELLGRPWSAEETSALCGALMRSFPQLQERCWRRFYQAPFPDENLETVAGYRQTALNTLARIAVREADWERFAPLVDAAASKEDRIKLWSWAVDAQAETFCPHYLAADGTGIEAPPDGLLFYVTNALTSCGRSEQARQILLDAGEIEFARMHDPRLTVAELQDRTRLLWAGSLPERSDVDDSLDAGGPELVGQVERWAQEDPEAVSPWLHLAFHHEAAGRAEEAVAAWRGLVAAHPDDLDLVVAMGAAALRLDHPDGLRSAARRLLSARHANARHRAEADYLLGRLARREGHWEEASERLERYFLRRLQFEGCNIHRRCDQAFILHLIDAGRRERLDAYLAARAEALATFETERWDPPEPHPQLRRPVEPPSTRLQVDVAALPLDCTSPRLLERLRALEAASPNDQTVAKRRADAEQRRPCTAEELPDPEETFLDDELLGLSWGLREVS